MNKPTNFDAYIAENPPLRLSSVMVGVIRRLRVAEYKHFKVLETSYVDGNYYEIIETLMTYSGIYAVITNRLVKGASPMYTHPREQALPVGTMVRLKK